MGDTPGTGGDPRVIELRNLSKRFGNVAAVQDLTARIEPGRVTGFLGPNGAGKTTTLRMLLGLVTATAGSATFGGRAYRELPAPLRTVGAVLEASNFHPGRSARNHLRVQATAAGLGTGRIDELLALVGLTPAARRRVGTYSLGMRQRLALATALLGDPGVLVLDEPSNGLDPEGIAWLRTLLRALAGQGRTVLVSSHVLSEVQQTVDDVIIIAHGRLLRQAPLSALATGSTVRIAAPESARLAEVLRMAGIGTRPGAQPHLLTALDTTAATVGHLAHESRIELHELHQESEDLEGTFLRLVEGPPAEGQTPGPHPVTSAHQNAEGTPA